MLLTRLRRPHARRRHPDAAPVLPAQHRRRGHEDPTSEPILTLRPLTCACPRLAKVVVTATAVGLLTGFFGVGGGFVLVPALVLALSFPMPVAVGTSLLVIAVNSATALTARISTVGTDLDWPLIAGFTAAAVAGSLVGGRITSRIHPTTLTRTFAVLLVAVALYTAARALPRPLLRLTGSDARRKDHHDLHQP